MTIASDGSEGLVTELNKRKRKQKRRRR